MKIVRFILIALLLNACIEKDSINELSFEVPQPEGQHDEKTIPQKLIGTYLSLSDSSLLTITKTTIINSHQITEIRLFSKMDSADRMMSKHDTAYSGELFKSRINVVVRGDSVFEKMSYSDTLFNFLRGDVLRKLNGYHFINREVTPNHWTVKKLDVSRKGLTMGLVTSMEELNSLREITNAKSDSVYTFNPTRKQWRKFLKEKGFQNEERFVKIKEGTFK
jgi:hypothetical protein